MVNLGKTFAKPHGRARDATIRAALNRVLAPRATARKPDTAGLCRRVRGEAPAPDHSAFSILPLP